MIRICILGDIGSGKTFTAKKFGYPVFDADNEVRKIYKRNKNCFKKLRKQFPNHKLTFPIKKKELLKIIIKNEKNIKKINKVIHPEVGKSLKKFIKKNKKRTAIVLDIPLLLEKKLNNKNDVLIFIEAKKIKIEKILKNRPNFNYGVYKKLKKLQLPLELKKKKSNYIIKNDFNASAIKKNVKILKDKIIKK